MKENYDEDDGDDDRLNPVVILFIFMQTAYHHINFVTGE